MARRSMGGRAEPCTFHVVTDHRAGSTTDIAAVSRRGVPRVVIPGTCQTRAR
jgi:hypothetical protein